MIEAESFPGWKDFASLYDGRQALLPNSVIGIGSLPVHD
jgi:hypothetical protein